MHKEKHEYWNIIFLYSFYLSLWRGATKHESRLGESRSSRYFHITLIPPLWGGTTKHESCLSDSKDSPVLSYKLPISPLGVGQQNMNVG
jgi:hypothetical protein